MCNTKPNLRAIAFALAALTATVPSLAHAGQSAPSETVRFDDLNLATEAGVKALDRRLDRAVERVCGTPSRHSFRGDQQIARCREDTWKSIQDEREVAIAHANGRENFANARADSGASQHARVSESAE